MNMAVTDFSQIPMSPVLAATLARASDAASATGMAEVMLEHLLAALCDDPDALAVLDASRVNTDRLRADAAGFLAHVQQSAPPAAGALTVSPDLRRILEAAGAAAKGGKRRDINGAIVLAAIVGDGKSVAAQMLQAQGLTFDEAIRALQSALAQPAERRAAQGAEDVLARARERVQSRAAPTLRDMTSNLPRPTPPPPMPAPVPSTHMPSLSSEVVGTKAPPAPLPVAEMPVNAPATPVSKAQSQPVVVVPEPVNERALPPAAQPVPPASPSIDDVLAELKRNVPSHPAPPPIPPPMPMPGTAPPVQRPMPPGSNQTGAIQAGSNQTGSMQSSDFGSPGPRIGAPVPSSPAPGAARQPQQPSAPAKRDRAKKAEAGQLAENIPRAMRVGKTERIEIRVAKAAAKAIVNGLEGGGVVWKHEIVVTQAMSVRLRAPEGGFFIETASPETQWIDNNLGYTSDDFASWRFLVTPQSRGWSRLQIIISARSVGADGMTAETAMPDQVIEVKVKANLKRTILRLLGWIAAAVAGGALARFGETGLEAATRYVQALLNS